jgi:hypothetical protein
MTPQDFFLLIWMAPDNMTALQMRRVILRKFALDKRQPKRATKGKDRLHLTGDPATGFVQARAN